MDPVFMSKVFDTETIELVGAGEALRY